MLEAKNKRMFLYAFKEAIFSYGHDYGIISVLCVLSLKFFLFLSQFEETWHTAIWLAARTDHDHVFSVNMLFIRGFYMAKVIIPRVFLYGKQHKQPAALISQRYRMRLELVALRCGYQWKCITNFRLERPTRSRKRDYLSSSSIISENVDKVVVFHLRFKRSSGILL